MNLEYLTVKLPIIDSNSVIRIESALEQWGDPIRWAITRTEAEHCIVEAVIYCSAAPSHPITPMVNPEGKL